MSDTIVKFDNVSKYYDMHLTDSGGIKNYLLNLGKRKQRKEKNRKVVFENLSFEIKRGELVAFIGRNGAGKSTLLSLISQVIRPDSGTIEVNSRISSMLELGAGFHPDLTGIENIELYGILMGFTKKEIHQKMDSIIEFAELKEYIYSPVRYYSSGMQARLGFSVISQLHPETIIVDEVLAVGDFKFRTKCNNVFQKFRDEGITIILVSHSGVDVKEFCTRAIWLDSGKICYDGLPEEALEAYEEKYT
ncbi:MAG: ABC transporter ATP-binding protein [Deferribacterales bacterium]